MFLKETSTFPNDEKEKGKTFLFLHKFSDSREKKKNFISQSKIEKESRENEMGI